MIRQAKAFNHFRKRLRERYGLENLLHSEWLDLRAQISNGHKNYFVGRKSKSKTWWIVRYREVQILALYCKESKGFLSCLPASKLKKALDGKQSVRNYLGLTDDSVMLRRYSEAKMEFTV